MKYRGTGPNRIELVLIFEFLESHLPGRLAGQLSRRRDHVCRSVDGRDLITTIKECFRIPTRPTARVKNQTAFWHKLEEGAI